MNEVRIRRRAAGSAQVAGDLAAVVCGVCQHVRDHVLHHAAEGFALGVAVSDFFVQFGGSERVEILLPLA